MRRVLFWVILLSFLLSTKSGDSQPRPDQSSAPDLTPRYVQGEVLVKYRQGISASKVWEFHQGLGIETKRKFKLTGIRQVKLPPSMAIGEALEIYRNNPDVEYAEPNYILHATATIPSDTYFTNLWGLQNTGQTVNGTTGTAGADVHATEAWDLTTGSSSVVIAVLDSGVDYNHPDLKDNIWTNPGEVAGNGIDDDGNGYVDDVRGWNFADNDNDPMDSFGHGTHVAGILAAKGDNGIGVAGVCWTAKIMPVRFLDSSGTGTVANEVAGIEYAVKNGAKIINASFAAESSTPSQAEKDAITSANSAGVLFIAAAGNSGTDNDTTPSYPASHGLPNIIAVAATDQNDNLATFSNYGATSVDVAAPGENIFSTIPARQTVFRDNFENGMNWTTGGTNNTWGLSDIVSDSPSHSLTDSPGVNVNYQNDTDSWAQSPAIDLSGHSGAKLEFNLRGISESGKDILYVQASIDGTNWSNLDAISGSSQGSWLSFAYDLGPYDGKSTVYIRFRFVTNDSVVYDGWYIGDVTVTASSPDYSDPDLPQFYGIERGTSMATPYVTGLAGLILSRFPGISSLEVKDRILNGAESRPSLSGKIATGGRINAYNSLILPSKVTGLTATATSDSSVGLAWTADANENGYRIERAAGTGGAFSEIATAGANEATYSNTGLTPGTTYSYRVRAFNSSGNSSYSDPVSATTTGSQPSDGGGGGGGGCFLSAAARR